MQSSTRQNLKTLIYVLLSYNDFLEFDERNIFVIIIGSGDWCESMCRLCDRTSPPPSKRAGTNPKEWGWVIINLDKH